VRKPANQAVETQELLTQCLRGPQAYYDETNDTTFTEPLVRQYLADANPEAQSWRLREEWLFAIEAVKGAAASVDRARTGVGRLPPFHVQNSPA
jgi:hypothetical protein